MLRWPITRDLNAALPRRTPLSDKPSTSHAGTIPDTKSPAPPSHPDSTAADLAAARDDTSDSSSVTASVSAVDDATRRTTRMKKRLEKALHTTASAADKAYEALASVIVFSEDIDGNHLIARGLRPPRKKTFRGSRRPD